jgi:triacylglycerol esterase/lipase EstA (alpha/beta hydrolase family)
VTTAISLALAVVAGTLAYAWWAARALADGVSALWIAAGVPVAYFAIPAALCLLWFTVSWLHRSPRPADVRLGLRDRLRLYWREVLAIAGSIPRMIFYRVLLRDPPPAPARHPVLLLHGVLCNAGVWHPMARYLAARGIGPLYALSYGPPLASIESFAGQAAAKIDAILAATGAMPVAVVAHSMGGLVARAYLRGWGGAKVRRVITLGTPHQGSVLAHVFPGRSLAEMRPGNRWLEELGRATAGGGPPIVSLWSWHDSMVAPQASSVLERAENVALMGIGHNALLADPAVFERVAAEIERAREDRPPSPVVTDVSM